jgi:hypothetical protein
LDIVKVSQTINPADLGGMTSYAPTRAALGHRQSLSETAASRRIMEERRIQATPCIQL